MEGGAQHKGSAGAASLGIFQCGGFDVCDKALVALGVHLDGDGILIRGLPVEQKFVHLAQSIYLGDDLVGTIAFNGRLWRGDLHDEGFGGRLAGSEPQEEEGGAEVSSQREECFVIHRVLSCGWRRGIAEARRTGESGLDEGRCMAAYWAKLASTSQAR